MKITDNMQKVAVDILERIIAYQYEHKEIDKEFFENVMKDYNLHEDPFTLFPCTSREYGKLREEYDKQLMIERFGYYE